MSGILNVIAIRSSNILFKGIYLISYILCTECSFIFAFQDNLALKSDYYHIEQKKYLLNTNLKKSIDVVDPYYEQRKRIVSSGFSDYFDINFKFRASATSVSGTNEEIQTKDQIYNILDNINHQVFDGSIGLNIADILNIEAIIGFYNYNEGNINNVNYSMLYGFNIELDSIVGGKLNCIIFNQPKYETPKDFTDKTKSIDPKDVSSAISIGGRLNILNIGLPFIDSCSMKFFVAGRYFNNQSNSTLAQVWSKLFDTKKYTDPKKLWDDITGHTYSLIGSLGSEIDLSHEASGAGILLGLSYGNSFNNSLVPNYIHNFMDEPCLIPGQDSYLSLKLEPFVNISDYGGIHILYNGFKIFNTNTVQRNGITETKTIAQIQHKFGIKLKFSF